MGYLLSNFVLSRSVVRVMQGGIIGLMAVITAPASAHTVRVDHHSGPVAAVYSGDVVLTHKQIGSVAPAGKTSSHRCIWTVSLSVVRVATTTAGNLVSRNFAGDQIATGSRTGWCSANKKALAREADKYEASKDAYLAKAAANDRSYLQSELKVLEPVSPVG